MTKNMTKEQYQIRSVAKRMLLKELIEAKFPLKDLSKMPTLLELIEACGDNFVNLYKVGKHWQVNCECKDGKVEEGMFGGFAEEAVANFWLKLKLKQ